LGLFLHPRPVWCSLPIVLPRRHREALDWHRTLIEQATEEEKRTEVRTSDSSIKPQRSEQETDQLIADLLSSLTLTQSHSTSPSRLSLSSSPSSVREMDERDTCKVCMTSEINCLLLPCAHMALCMECGNKLTSCPLCRQVISARIRPIRG
jgi:hypothetical protein